MTDAKKIPAKRKGKDPRLVALGNRVRSLRKEAGFSQEDFAYYCNLHPNYLGGIERGERNVAIINLYRIAEGLKLKLSELLDF